MIATLINFIIWLMVLGLIYWLVIWMVDTIPIPNPPGRIIKIVAMVVLCLVVIIMLLGLLGVSTGLDMPRIIS